MTPASTLAAALETALDLYLKQDPGALQRCAEMEAKVIQMDITGLGLSLYFMPGAEGVLVAGHYEGEPDTRLRGSPFGFARLSLGSREQGELRSKRGRPGVDALFDGTVEILGDSDTGQQFQDMLSAVDWDWEEQLSQLTGDVVAHQAGRLARETMQFISNSSRTLQQDISEYLQEEARLLPAGIEVGYFLAEVDQLRADVDRLNARVDRLAQTRDPKA